MVVQLNHIFASKTVYLLLVGSVLVGVSYCTWTCTFRSVLWYLNENRILNIAASEISGFMFLFCFLIISYLSFWISSLIGRLSCSLFSVYLLTWYIFMLRISYYQFKFVSSIFYTCWYSFKWRSYNWNITGAHCYGIQVICWWEHWYCCGRGNIALAS